MSDEAPPPRPEEDLPPPAPLEPAAPFEPPAPLGAAPPPMGMPPPPPPPGRAPVRPAPRGRRPHRRFRQFNFGKVLGDTFAVYFKRLPAILVVAVIIAGPVAVFSAWANPTLRMLEDTGWDTENETWEEYEARRERMDPDTMRNITIGLTLLGHASKFLLAGAIAYLVVRAQQRRPAGVGEVLGRGLRRFPAILGATVLIWIVVTLMFVPAMLAGAIAESMPLMFMFLMAAMIPAVIWGLSVSVAVPACAVERLGPIASLSRSRELTRGYRWHLFGLFLLLMVIMWMIGIALMVPMTMMMMRGEGGQGFMLFHYIGEAVSALVMTPLFAVMIAVAYVELRAVNEGVDADGVADVFA